MDRFEVHGIELFNQPYPCDPSAVQEPVWIDGWGWMPLDAPNDVPAGSTKRIEGELTGIKPFGCTALAHRW